MLLMYGEPTFGNGYSTHEISWEQCYSMCYWDANCSLSYYFSSQCELYQYGNYSIKQWTSSDEKLIAVKRNLSTETCPSKTVQLAVTDSYEDNDVVFINRTISNGTHWLITYNETFECDIGTKLFLRGNYWVCVGVRLIDHCANYKEAAIDLCSSDGWMNVTGPYSNEELNYFLANKGTIINSRTPALWVDGMNGQFMDFTHNEDYSYPKCTSYSRNDCAYIGYTGYNCVTQGECYWTYYGSYCWRGATCLKSYVDVS